MSKERETVKALVKLAACPRTRANCPYSSVCSHREYGDQCATVLCKEYGYIFDELNSCLASKGELMTDNHNERAVIDDKALRLIISDAIHGVGIPANLLGYRYAREAIFIVIKNPEAIDSITKVLYPTVAKTFNTTASKVERAIRHSIEVAWDRCDIEVLQDRFGYTVSLTKGKPTNSEFIALIAENIRLSLDD